MNESLQLIFKRLLAEVPLLHYRYLYQQFNLNNRLTGLLGARGVGKTTLLLQFIKNNFSDNRKVFYCSADHIFFQQTTLYQFVEELFLTDGIEIFFIDEIHKYKNWSQELKNLYDGFPKIKLIFSGSSSLDLVKGGYDLSRRLKTYHLVGLSFREYLNLTLQTNFQPSLLQNLIDHASVLDSEISVIPGIKGHFQNYLRYGYYPFYHEDPLSYYEKILSVINKTIFEDIANFYSLNTVNLQIFLKILNFLSHIEPGDVNVHNIGKNLAVDDKTIMNYLQNLQDAGLIQMIYSAATGNVALRRPQKIFLDNTNLQYAIVGTVTHQIKIGSVRELFFVQSVSNAGHEVYHSKKGDYVIDEVVYEIGGKNKTDEQVKGVQKAILVKDDQLIARRNEIPLLYFGFLY